MTQGWFTRRRFSSAAVVSAIGALLITAGARPVRACVGSGCLQIWSTADGSGALTMQWDFAEKVQTVQSFCAPDNSTCLYSTIDPGFMAPTDAATSSGFYRLVDGTTVTVEVVSADPSVSMNINGRKIYQPGDVALLGTMPTIHVHPSWQLVVPGTQFGDLHVAFKLTTDSPLYADSQVFTLTVTNIQPTPGSPTPTVTPTPEPTPCDGDCSGDGAVTVNELVVCVNMALGTSDACHACDANGDGMVTINEIIAAVGAALNGCPMLPTVTLADVQQSIFTPRCATAGCHDTASATGNLVLVDGSSYGQLVNVEPSVPLAAQAGQFRVDPGHPENSFLLVKLAGPPLGEGSPMPLTGTPLTPAEIEMIRDWILQGAQP